MKNKKNNKGFSLVELIVVVLIMAIIAVALAPQVMKWVDNSRKAADVSNYDSLISAAQLTVISEKPTATVTVTMSDTGTAITPDTQSAFINKFAGNLPGYGDLKAKVSSASYTFTISTEGAITRGTEPDGNIS